MKKILMIALSALVACGSAVSAKVFEIPVKRAAKERVAAPVRHDTKRYKAKAADAATLWRSQTQKSFGWDGTEWQLTETAVIAYDGKGQMSSQDMTDEYGTVVRETYTWNDNGMLATRFTTEAVSAEDEFENSSRLAREYDARLTSFITSNDQAVWVNGEWTPSNSYTQTITRNTDGNVTLMERAVYFEGIFDPTYRLAVTYGDDGKATKITESDLTYDFTTGEYLWVESKVYSDIVWEETDGQIVQTEDLFSGNNRIKSAVLTKEETQATITVEYRPGGYTATMKYHDEAENEDVLSRLLCDQLVLNNAPHGQYGWEYLTVTDYSVEGEVYYTESYAQKFIYDENDLIILEKVEFSDGTYAEIESMTAGEVVYDQTNGYPLSWTVSEYDYTTEEMENVFRTEFEDYVNAALSGIDNIVAEDTDNTPVYYNLQGQRVANPAAGLYIRVVGDKSTKVLIR